MKKMTSDNLKAAFAGESQAHMRYLAFADKAEQEGKPNVARLFRAIAYAEQVHATNHLRTLDGIGSTSENLAAAVGGETFEVEEMYPAYLTVAKFQDEQGAQQSITGALETEKVHMDMYKDAKNAVDGGKDLDVSPIGICQACGFTVEGKAPGKCPVCGVPAEKFRMFE